MTEPSATPTSQSIPAPEVIAGEVRPSPPFRLWHVLALGVWTYLLINVLAMIFILPWLISHQEMVGRIPLQVLAKASIPAMTLAYILLVWAMKTLLRLRGYPQFLATLGWRWPRRSEALLVTIGAAATSFAVIFLLRFLPIPNHLPIEEMLKDRTVLLAFILFSWVPAPLVEELYFRGLLYPALIASMGASPSEKGAVLSPRHWIAILLTALAFAGLHAGQLGSSIGPLGIIFVVGIVLTWLRAVSGSVAVSFLFHALYNFLIPIATLLLK